MHLHVLHVLQRVDHRPHALAGVRVRACGMCGGSCDVPPLRDVGWKASRRPAMTGRVSRGHGALVVVLSGLVTHESRGAN